MPTIHNAGLPNPPSGQNVTPATSDSPDAKPADLADTPNAWVAWAELVTAAGSHAPHHVNRANAAARRFMRAVT